jgi:hypothetical protein
VNGIKMAPVGRPPKGGGKKTIEYSKPWEHYGICRASWYQWRHNLDSGNIEGVHLEIMRLRKLRMKNREEAKKIEEDLKNLNK